MTSLTRRSNKQKITFWVTYQCCLAFLATLVFFSDLSGILNAYGIGVPLFWMIGFLFLATPLFPFISRKSQYLPRSIFVWFGIYLAMTSIVVLVMPNSAIDIQQIMEDQIRSMIFISLMILIFSEHFVVQQCTKLAVLVVSVFNVLFLIAQFLKPTILLEVQDAPGRSGGFYIDPNMASCALNMGLIFSIGLIKPKYRLIYALFILMGNAVTFSRGGMACWFLIVLIFTVLKILPVFQLPILIVSVLVTAVIISSQINNLAFMTTPDGDTLFKEGTIERVRFLANPFAKGEAIVEEEDDSRLVLIQLGWEKFSKSPWYGNGLGSGQHEGVKTEEGSEQRSHNIYLDRMIEYGFLGALIYPLLILASVWKAQGEHRKYAIVFAIYALIWGLFSHTVFTNFFILTSIAFMAVLTKQSRLEHAQEQEIASRY
jgi:hypothetical protein